MTKQNILLDLDQTIISSEAYEEYDFKKNHIKSKKFKYHDMESYYIVFERPGLQDFLDFLFKNFNVSVWTAASKDYALFIIEKVIISNKPKRKLDWIFFSYHCDISKRIKNQPKDLSILWEKYKLKKYNSQNTFIIDDYDKVYNNQPNNCIIATPFEFTNEESEKDDFFTRLKPLIKTINKNNSVSIINKKMKTNL